MARLEERQVVVRLEEDELAKRQVLIDPGARGPDVGEDSDTDASGLDSEAAWFNDIVRLREAMHGEAARRDGGADAEDSRLCSLGAVFGSHAVPCPLRHKGVRTSLLAEADETIDMVGMLMGDEHVLYFADVDMTRHRPVFEFTETDAHVDHHCLVATLNVIDITIAA